MTSTPATTSHRPSRRTSRLSHFQTSSASTLCTLKRLFYERVCMNSAAVEAQKTWNVVTGLVAFVLMACVSSSTIERRGGTAYAPMNEQRGGSLRYYENTRTRDDVYKEMYAYCGGNYEIVNERDVNRGTTTNYNRYSYNTTTTTMVEHVIDFRCVNQPAQRAAVTLTGDEWRIARDTVAQQSGCPSANVEHEVTSPTAGAKGYAVEACGQRWLCSAGNGVAACAPDRAAGRPAAPMTPAAPVTPQPTMEPVPVL